MTIEYNGRTYTVNRRYKITMNGYRLRTSPQDTSNGTQRIWGKLVLKKYMDAEMYAVDYHYGFVFEYKRVWQGVERIEEITLPDALERY